MTTRWSKALPLSALAVALALVTAVAVGPLTARAQQGTPPAGVTGQVTYAPEKAERHPHLHAALHELRAARKELKEADHDFNGHREDALKAVDVAIEQLEKALTVDRK